MTETIHVLGISGSLRKGSYNSLLLRAAQELLPEGMHLEIADISDIPLYNGDLDKDPQPAAVTDFKAQIRAADALLIATPEYNYSVPGVLKNALDWASTPAKDSPFTEKPAAIMGAGGLMGTSRAQYHLRQMAVSLNLRLLNRPEVFVNYASQHFDADGRLVTELHRQNIQLLLAALKDWTLKLR